MGGRKFDSKFGTQIFFDFPRVYVYSTELVIGTFKGSTLCNELSNYSSDFSQDIIEKSHVYKLEQSSKI